MAATHTTTTTQLSTEGIGTDRPASDHTMARGKAHAIASMVELYTGRIATHVDIVTNGYSVVTDDRAHAYDIAAAITRAFGGDPEAGHPTIAVQPHHLGHAVYVIID